MADEFKHGSVGTTLTQNEWEGIGTHVIDSQATGDIIYATSASQLSRLGIGATGKVLKVAGGIPSWDDVDAGDLSGTTLNSGVVTTSITTVGTLATGTWNATAITAQYGGTSQSSWATGDMLYASGTDTLAKLSIGTTDQQLRVTALGAIEWFTPTASGASVGLAMAFAIVF
tara:strand:+ start:1234 stop:1749 length:516 start_codon:yes stop_codon:yes gene_type:complete